VNYDIPLEVQVAALKLHFFAIINFIEIKLIVGLFFSESFELSLKIKVMYQLSQRLISSICKYPSSMEGAARLMLCDSCKRCFSEWLSNQRNTQIWCQSI
jgi:hypothetical protein